MKKITSSVMLVVLLLSALALSASAQAACTMYAPDGRTISVWQSEVSAYQNVGWYTVPVSTMYAPDGRTIVVWQNEVSAYQRVGWYTAPVTTMFAPDGRSIIVLQSDVKAYQNVGWYIKPVTTMYAPDGRSITVYTAEVSAYKNVGWYETQAAASAANKETILPDLVHVQSITFNVAKNVYVISGEETKIVGEYYQSGAPILSYGKTVTVELRPNEIVDYYGDKITIKSLYEDYYLSEYSDFRYYPMLYEVRNKSFGNYGN